MEDEDSFLLQLSKAIQKWLWVESELYMLYSMFMQGANPHLVSVTFNNIQSVDSKLALLNSCFKLALERGCDDLNQWNAIFGKVEKLNKKRNKLVHEPVSKLYVRNVLTEVRLGPSYFNSLAIAKGQTTHQGKPVISPDYDPSKVKILDGHRLKQNDVAALERSFQAAALEMRSFREAVSPKVTTALGTSRKPRQ